MYFYSSNLIRNNYIKIILFSLLFSRLFYSDFSSFVNDEPNLQKQVIHAIQEKKVPLIGLSGSQPIPYGPTPAILYLVARTISQSHTWVWMFHAFAQVLAFAMVWSVFKSRYAKAPFSESLLPWVVSPFLFFYSRTLWDNTWLIVLSSIQLWCCHKMEFSYQKNNSRMPFGYVALSGLLGSMMVSTHLMSLPFAFCSVLYCLCLPWTTPYDKNAFLHKAKHMIEALSAWTGVFVVGLFPYLSYIWSNMGHSALSAATHGGNRLSWIKLTEVLSTLGGLNNSKYFLNYVFTGSLNEWGVFEGNYLALTSFMNLSSILSLLVPLGCLAILFPISIRFRSKFENWYRTWSFEIILGLLPVVLTVLMQWKKNLPQHPHYYHFLWWCPVLCYLSCHNELGTKWKRIISYFTWAVFVCNLYSLIAFVVFISKFEGTRGLGYGSIVKNQMNLISDLCQEVKTHDSTHIDVDISNVAILNTSLEYFVLIEKQCAGIDVNFNTKSPPSCRVNYASKPDFTAKMIAQCAAF